MNSTPKIHEIRDALESIRGTVPAPGEMPRGCRFSPRCRHAVDKCRNEAPVLQELCADYQVRCWLPEQQEVAKDER